MTLNNVNSFFTSSCLHIFLIKEINFYSYFMRIKFIPSVNKKYSHLFIYLVRNFCKQMRKMKDIKFVRKVRSITIATSFFKIYYIKIVIVHKVIYSQYLN